MKSIKIFLIVNIIALTILQVNAQEYDKGTNLLKVEDCEKSEKQLLLKTLRIVKSEGFSIKRTDADLLMFTTNKYEEGIWGRYNVALDVSVMGKTVEIRGYTNYTEEPSDRERVYKRGMKGSPARKSFDKMAEIATTIKEKCGGTLYAVTE